MNIADQLLQSGFDSLNGVHGVSVTSDTGETCTVVVEQIPEIADPAEIAKAKTPIYCRLHTKSGSVRNPRSIGKFTVTGGTRWYRVLKYEESSDPVEWCWLCEMQREVFQ